MESKEELAGGVVEPSDTASSPSHSGSGSGTITNSNKRETFTNKIDFLMACVGYSVGFGNFWRFPYLCYKNGGGAFLIPYFIMVILAGIPMFFLEVSLGQFMSAGGIKCWKISPLFEGIGWATTIILFLLNCYYNVILAWAFYYLFASFTSTVPWSHCDNDFNTEFCRTDWTQSGLAITSDVYFNKTLANGTVIPVANQTTVNGTKNYYTDPVTEYWQRKVLGMSSGIEEMGAIKWDLALCLLLAWLVVFACISKGVKTSGKVMYVTATLPYLFMLILLIRGCILPGAGTGIVYYLRPNITRLGTMDTWVDAGTQIFFSYSIGIGASTALGSFNKFHHNSYKDSIIFAIVNSGTSFMAGFVIFAVLGHMSYQQGVDISDVAESGPGLAFIAYPKALSTMPIAPLWSVFFFIMLILLGLDSEFVQQEGLVAAIVDIFPNFLRKGHRRIIFTGVMCAVCYLVGLSMCTNGGLYLFQIFDFYSGSRIILLVAFFECVAIAWTYGVDRFMDNLQMMYGFRVNFIWKFAFLAVTPLVVMVIFVLNCISYQTLSIKFSAHYTYNYPGWAITFGWLMACSSIIMVPINIIYRTVRMIMTTERPWPWNMLIRPRLLPHQMRPGDDPMDLDRHATMDNTFLPQDVLDKYDGKFENYIGDNRANGEPVAMEEYQLKA